MSRKRTLAALACAGVAVGLIAAPAQAQLLDMHRESVQERLGVSGLDKVPVLRTKGSKQYKILVEGYLNTVSIVAQKGNSAATYSKKGKASPTRLRAKFGKFGKVDVRFKKKGKVRKQTPRNCTGTPNRIQPGVWRGVVKFKGENGFTKVNVKSAKGTVTKPGNLDCEPTGGDGDWVTLQAFKSTPKSNVNFFADKRTDVPNARPAFMASAYNAHGKIDIGRSVFMRGKPAQFTYTLPDQAQVKPKGLFSGQATLSGESWTGNLKVKLPGKRVALAGPAFTGFLFGMGL